MNKILICFFLFGPATIAVAQKTAKYDKCIKTADSLYQAKQFTASAVKYNEAFSIKPRTIKSNHVYNAACSWALAGNADSAFYYLIKTAQKFKYSDVEHVTTDSDLRSLYSDKRWAFIVSTIKLNQTKAEQKLNKDLINFLDSIYRQDQAMRSQIDSVEQKYGLKSKERNDLFAKMAKVDSSNLLIAKKLLNKYGWLGNDVVGDRGNETIWLVIQHSDLKTQIKYIPKLRRSVSKGLSHPYYLAYMEDRIAMNQGKEQIYGSQITHDLSTGKYSIYPIRDEVNVDERRKAMGMRRLAEDAKMYGIDYVLPK